MADLMGRAAWAFACLGLVFAAFTGYRRWEDLELRGWASPPSMGGCAAGVTLYTASTPNGWKASIALEELGVSYKIHKMALWEGEQKQDWYLAINPNGRIPAMVDHGAGERAVWESGAILLYLAESCDPQHRLLPTDPAARSECLSWLFWQMGGLGPMQGQADYFLVLAEERHPAAIERYVNETERLYGVLERRLEGRRWLAGDAYSIADISCFTWAIMHDICAIPFSSSYPNVRAWVDRIKAREAVQHGVNVPEDNFVLSKLPQWQGMLARARERLAGLKPWSKPEE